MNFDEAVSRVAAALQRELPGAAAQAVAAPRPRRQWPAGFNPARIRLAAGLLLLYRAPGDEAHIVLTVRADTVRHGGQVSLPGGVVDPGETFERAALREAQEEVGLAEDGIQVLGSLTPLDIPVSGFRLHPVVAALGRRPQLRPSDSEVARILEIAVADLLDPTSLVENERRRDGLTLAVPGFHVGGVEIWGATAMVVAEFLALLGWRHYRP